MLPRGSGRRPAWREVHDAFRTVRRRRPRVRHLATRHAAPLDQLPGQRGLLRHHLQHRRRVLLLSRRPPPAIDALSLQQRPDGRRGSLPLPARRLHRSDLVAVLATDAHRPRGLPVPARPRLHGDRFTPRRDRGGDPVLRAARGDARDLADEDRQPSRRSCAPVAVQRHRVLPVGRAGRCDELPAELLDRRGRGRGRRDLPQDRVPGAARSLRLLRVLGRARRLRHATRCVPGAVPGVGPSARAGARALRRLDRPRVGTDRVPPRRAVAGSGRDAGDRLPPRVRGEPARPEVRPAGVADDRQASASVP